MLKPVLFSLFFMLVSNVAHAGAFSITIQPQGTIDSDTLASFNNAVSFWESAILGTQEAININLVIDASTPYKDGPGGVLGSAGPTVGSYQEYIGNFLYASRGEMEFDSADVSQLKSNGTLFDVILHEMAHVMGFGTLWNPAFTNGGTQQFQNLYTDESGKYTGAHALALYQEIYDSSATFIPVELDGGSGTANAHWDEGFLGNVFLHESELLTGYLDSSPYISDISLASFADLGYTVRLSDGRILGQVSSPSTFAFYGLALLLLVNRRYRNTG